MAKKTQEIGPLGAVLYTDGGCRPGYTETDPKGTYGGWGFHGYQYPIGKHPPKLRTKKDVQTTLGYQIGETVSLNDQVVVNGYIDGFGSLDNNDTNNVAELHGLRNALIFAKEKDYQKVHFLLDSQYVISGVKEYYQRWEQANWRKPDGSYYQNKTLWQEVMHLWNQQTPLKEYSIDWVNGHSGNLGNDRADRLATRGVFLGRNGKVGSTQITESPIAKYGDYDVDINRLFAKNRLYFNPMPGKPSISHCGRYVYHCGSHGPDDTLVGKPISDSVASVIYTKQPEQVIDATMALHARLVNDPYNDLCMMRLDTLLLPRVYHEIQTYGVEVLSLAPGKLRYRGLCTTEDNQVTKVISPPGLTFKLIAVHKFMENELDMFIQGKSLSTEITDMIYKTTVQVKKKKELEVTESILTPDMKFIKVMVKRRLLDGSVDEKEITLTIGLDLPSRETLKAISSRKPKVYVVTWKISDSAFSYATIIDCGDDIMIQMAKDSNMQLVYPDEVYEEIRRLTQQEKQA